jgi:hypothetical protein
MSGVSEGCVITIRGSSCWDEDMELVVRIRLDGLVTQPRGAVRSRLETRGSESLSFRVPETA